MSVYEPSIIVRVDDDVIRIKGRKFQAWIMSWNSESHAHCVRGFALEAIRIKEEGA